MSALLRRERRYIQLLGVQIVAEGGVDAKLLLVRLELIPRGAAAAASTAAAIVALICVARNELLDVHPGWGGGKINATSLLLEPLAPEECADLIDRLVPDAVLDPVLPALLGGLSECITPRGEVRTLPFHLWDLDGMDGFYAARLIKKS